MFRRPLSNVVSHVLKSATQSTANAMKVSTSISSASVNEMQLLVARQFSTAAKSSKKRFNSENNEQSGYQFKKVWMSITGGFIATGALVGGLSIKLDKDPIQNPSYPPLWFQNAFELGVGAAVGSVLGGAFGAFAALPIAYAAEFPIPAAVIGTGIALRLAYQRYQLFSSRQETTDASDTAAPKPVAPKSRP